MTVEVNAGEAYTFTVSRESGTLITDHLLELRVQDSEGVNIINRIVTTKRVDDSAFVVTLDSNDTNLPPGDFTVCVRLSHAPEKYSKIEKFDIEIQASCFSAPV